MFTLQTTLQFRKQLQKRREQFPCSMKRKLEEENIEEKFARNKVMIQHNMELLEDIILNQDLNEKKVIKERLGIHHKEKEFK